MEKENTVSINIELVGYEDLVKKLEKIKELLNDIENIKIEVE